MIMNEEIDGLNLYPQEFYLDSRGRFTRLMDLHNLGGILGNPSQINVSENPQTRTLRGMHYQIDGLPEHKFISLLSGSIFLCVVDVRKQSRTYKNTKSFYMDNSSNESVLVPAGCATGWITLEANSIIHYVMTSRFQDNLYSGFRFDDPVFSLDWPCSPRVISEKDKKWPGFIP